MGIKAKMHTAPVMTTFFYRCYGWRSKMWSGYYSGSRSRYVIMIWTCDLVAGSGSWHVIQIRIQTCGLDHDRSRYVIRILIQIWVQTCDRDLDPDMWSGYVTVIRIQTYDPDPDMWSRSRHVIWIRIQTCDFNPDPDNVIRIWIQTRDPDPDMLSGSGARHVIRI